MKYIAAIDQGTTSSRAIIYDSSQNITAISQKEYTQIYPQPGWVEHDPMEIYSTQKSALEEAIAKSPATPADIAAIGIANQRETTILWDKHTGKPVHNAIVWQCRRTAPYCEELKKKNLSQYIKNTTGLIPDAYFSATKIMWLLDNIPGIREKAEKGDILFGTVDTWLIWNLSNRQAHVTDYTNASRTMLFNINTLKWDDELLKELNIPYSILPKVVNSGGTCTTANIQGTQIPISGIAGDQQAALLGQQCTEKGDAKNTYGTGCFLLMNTGEEIIASNHGLITTIAATVNADGKPQYALEGSVFTAGAAIQWLRDELKLISSAEESEQCALSVNDTAGVCIVPAFTGLGAPHWDMTAKGLITGITRSTNRSHIVRAALESIAYQTKDVLDAMQADTGIELKELSADGGASANNFLMQFQADILNKPIKRPATTEATALGAAYLAGLSAGVWKDIKDLKTHNAPQKRFTPSMLPETRQTLLNNWQKAIRQTQANILFIH